MTARFSPSPSVQSLYATAFVFSLCALPLVAFFSARAMSILPGIVALLFAALWPFLHGGKVQFSRSYFAWAGFLSLLCAASALWSPDQSFALEKAGKIALVLLPGALLFSLAQSLSDARAGLFSRALPAFVIVAGVCIIAELAFNLPLHRFIEKMSFDETLSSAVVNRSIFCAFSALFIAFAVAENNKIRIALVFCAVLALALSQSQSNQLALALAALAYFLFPYARPKIYYVLAAMVAALIFAAPFLAQWMFAHLALAADGTPWLKEGYASSRMEIWDFVARHVLQNPFKGYGVESTRFIHFDAAGLYYASGDVLHPHNFALQLWGEFGLWGAFIGAGFFAFLFSKLKNLAPAQAKIALPTLVYVLCVAAMGYGLWQGWQLGQFTVLLAFLPFAFKAASKN